MAHGRSKWPLLRGGLFADNHEGGSRGTQEAPTHRNHEIAPRAVAGTLMEQTECALTSGQCSDAADADRLVEVGVKRKGVTVIR